MAGWGLTAAPHPRYGFVRLEGGPERRQAGACRRGADVT